MGKMVAKTGNEAMAEAMRQINPDVVAAYPITPATEVVQIFSTYVADGLVQTEFIAVESEHSAMSACLGAVATGARTMTSTASQGLALMWEMLYIASGLRLPIVMAEVNRALSAPINIHCDHSDTMGARDSGWIQIYSENAQEAYDNLIQGVRIAEECLLPTMVMADGFIISHGMESMEILEDKEVQDFVGEYNPSSTLINSEKPITMGALDFTDYYFEHRRSLAQAMIEAKEKIIKISQEYSHLSKRKYQLFEKYMLDDAEIAIVVIGSTAGTAKVVINELREKKIKAGLLKIRVFRPFPGEELKEALANIPVIAVLDRADSLSTMGGPLFIEIKSSLYGLEKQPQVVNYIYGLGGRDINLHHLREIYQDLQSLLKTGKVTSLVKYLGVRE
ncbi:pyruvate ferredoxin oxidoreductase [bacterium]|nr:pyruvate ferredoxin oxidoreductase [bacterium]MBU1153052.1 pyruvate ferredoxin oxidoreductase [bacterium]MBU2600028.1 pyruvate ferredoxin oxidoreductase [bacterium]